MRESFHRLLSEHNSEADIRRIMQTTSGYDPDLWRLMADMGLPGLLIDPDLGGVGASAVELELLMEEAGAHLLCAPFLSSGVLAAALLNASADDEAKTRLLPKIAAGEQIAAVAVTGECGLWTPDDVRVTAEHAEGEWILNGVACFVISGSAADILLVVARTSSGLAAFEVNPLAPGVVISPLKTFDQTLRLSRMAFDRVPGAPIAGADAETVAHMLNLARVALAGEQAGAARHVLQVTVDYLKTRVQFGRPVGSFQALKHIVADLLVEAESAISAARAAAAAMAEGAPDADALVNLASFTCADTFNRIAAESIDLHGGIGFTWEHPAHLYWRRARADAQLFGSAAVCRDRYVSALERASDGRTA
jgi:alkylation response protein AidB-like acyl-CoA dehydrogenase